MKPSSTVRYANMASRKASTTSATAKDGISLASQDLTPSEIESLRKDSMDAQDVLTELVKDLQPLPGFRDNPCPLVHLEEAQSARRAPGKSKSKKSKT